MRRVQIDTVNAAAVIATARKLRVCARFVTTRGPSGWPILELAGPDAGVACVLAEHGYDEEGR